MLPTLLKEHERRLRRKSTMVYKRQSKKKKKIFCTCLSCIIFIFISIWIFGWNYFFFNINIDQKIIEKVNLMDKNTNAINDNHNVNKDNNNNNNNNNAIGSKNKKLLSNNNKPPPLNTCNEITYYIEQNDLINPNTLVVAGGQLLRPNVLYENARVKYGEYVYFQACLPKYNDHHHFHNVEIQVKVTDGDPDLYISQNKMKPTKTTSTWISKSIGGETIKLPSNLKEFPKGAQTLYVGVYGGGNKFNYKKYLEKQKKNDNIDDDDLFATFSIIVSIRDRENPYKNLRLRKGDTIFKEDVEHETWKPKDEE